MKSDNRIAVVSEDLSGPWRDEIHTFVTSLRRELEKKNGVLHVDAAGARTAAGERRSLGAARLNRSILREVRNFSPEQVIYVPSPSGTWSMFVRAHRLRRAAPTARHGMVVLVAARKPGRFNALLKRLYPGTVFVPSYRSLLFLSRLSLRGDVLPFGVDLGSFAAAQPGEKEAARKRLNIDPGSYVFLCRAPFGGRSLEPLVRLRRLRGARVVLFTKGEAELPGPVMSDLERSGVRVLPNPDRLYELYRLADCFVLSLADGEEFVEVPASVLEALSSGIPVLTTPFGGLKDFLAEGSDLRYWTSADELLRAARRLRESAPVRVRDMTGFGWNRIAEKILDRLGR